MTAALNLWWRMVHAAIGTGDDEQTTQRAERALLLVRVFYAFVLFLAFPWSSLSGRAWMAGKVARAKLDLLLPSLLPHDSWLGADAALTLLLTVGAMVALLDPRPRWPRVLVALSLTFHLALHYDVKGKVDHGLHPTVWVAYAFAFLPNPKSFAQSIDAKRALLSVFFGAQVLIGLLYSCAGFCKVLGVLYDFGEGPTWFHPEALPLTLAENWPKSQDTLLAAFLIDRPLLGWGLNAGVLYLELATIVAFFKPRLQRIWAVGLIMMHTAIMHSMAIHFHQSVLILCLLLIPTPFAKTATVLECLSDLPIFGLLIRRIPWARSRLSENTPSSPVWQPHWASPLSWWLPLTLLLYVPTAYSRLQLEQGEWEQDLYPVSAQWMYWRIDSSERNTKQLARIRKSLEKGHPQK